MIKTRDIEPRLLEKEYNVKLPRIRSAKELDFTLKAYAKALDTSKPLLTRISNFIAGESKLGRKAGIVLDFATFFLPFGRQIQTGREAVNLVLNRKQRPMIKKALLRAFTGDGGGKIKIRDENGKIDLSCMIAFVVRAVVIVAVFWIAGRLGLDVTELLTFIGI